MQAAMDTRERQATWRERKKQTHTRIGDLWLRNDLVPVLDALCARYGVGRVEMIERLIEERNAGSVTGK